MSAQRPFPRRQVFLLGHMRSYSSVLSHILASHPQIDASHPQIDGGCESHIKYRTRFDLWRLQHRVRKLTGKPLRGDYVLDEVLHDYPLAASILSSSRTRAVVLVRRPADSVRSIIETGLTDSPVPWHRDFERVARYYVTRLAGLLRLTEALRGRVVFLEAESLLSNTQEVLDQLAAFLELQSPLQAGSISGAPRASQTAVSLPRALVVRLQNAYDFWCGAIRKSCPTIRPSGALAIGGDERSHR
jgi:hypothetical protein